MGCAGAAGESASGWLVAKVGGRMVEGREREEWRGGRSGGGVEGGGAGGGGGGSGGGGGG